jgi:hypothetical protein
MTHTCANRGCSNSTDGVHVKCNPCRAGNTPAVRARNAEARKDTRTPEQKTKERLDLARAQRDLSDMRAQNRHLQKLALSSEGLREMIGTLPAPSAGDPEWLKGPAKPRSVTGTGLLMISDIHAGEVVKGEQLGGANAYNLEICERRLRNTFVSCRRLLKEFLASPRFDGIVVPLGGDLFSGNIHEELQKTNEEPILRTMLRLETWLIDGLTMLADEFGRIHVPAVTGNHGRMTRKPEFKNRAHENYEWLTYQRLALHFAKDSRFTFDIPDGPDAYFPIYSQRFALTHGDQFRGGDGVGGIIVPIRRGLSRKQFRDNQIGRRWETMLIGHWHAYHHMNDLVVNGSVKGADEYSYGNNFGFEPPTQALFVVHPKVGVTARWPVFCDYRG